ncbi:MAG: LysR substrate-binding domain-containing protein [Betaproteobacteria bacterium]
MTLQQLRYFCEIATQDWNISQAAKVLHTSQPGMSRQMHALEQELGVRMFARRGNRIVGLTGPGRAALKLAQRILADTAKMRGLGGSSEDEAVGSLTLAATHTQARYILPDAVKQFTRGHPEVQVYLKQGIPAELVRLVASGEADISVCGMPAHLPDDVVMLPCFEVERIVVVPRKHPLLKAELLTLERIAKYPLITYDETFALRHSVLGAFERAGFTPKVVIAAVDTDVMKTYAAAGLGIAIVSGVAYNAGTDRELRALHAGDILGRDTIYIGLRRHTYLRRYVYDFIRLFAPKVTADRVAKAIELDV